jgi:hypothetical protein
MARLLVLLLTAVVTISYFGFDRSGAVRNCLGRSVEIAGRNDPLRNCFNNA